MTALKVVYPRQKSRSSGSRVYEVKEPQAPAGFRVRYGSTDIAGRRPRRGEIKRLVQAFLIKFYRDLDAEVRHETLDLYEIQEVISARLGYWLGGLLGSDEGYYYVPPCAVAHILRSTEVDGCYFEVRKDTVRLMVREEGEPKPSISIRRAE